MSDEEKKASEKDKEDKHYMPEDEKLTNPVEGIQDRIDDIEELNKSIAGTEVMDGQNFPD